MTQLKKRATALLLGSVTFFIALAMPYNTTRVYAVDVAFSWVVNESSNTILNWILLYLGISVAPEAISEGKVFDKTGQFAMDFCNEFFGDTFEQWYVSNGFSDDIDTFKREFNDILTQDFDAAKYVAGDVKSSVLDIIYKYLVDNSSDFSGVYSSDLSSDLIINSGESAFARVTGSFYVDGRNSYIANVESGFGGNVTITNASSPVRAIGSVIESRDGSSITVSLRFCSFNPFDLTIDGTEYNCADPSYGVYTSYYTFSHIIPKSVKNLIINWECPHIYLPFSTFNDVYSKSISKWVYGYLSGSVVVPNIDIPNVAGKDWAYDLVGWPNAWDIDKPDVKPWDDVDSLPIPGDIAIPQEIPGVTDLPGIMDGVIGGTIPWPDIIDIIKDLPVNPTPDPEPEPEPDPDPELPEIPAVLPQGVSDKLKDLSGKFPFCIPFDVVDCYKSFATKDNAEAPKWDIDFTIPGTNQQYHFSVDLSMFEKYIPIFRSGVLILFFIGLLLATRKLIGWQIDN